MQRGYTCNCCKCRRKRQSVTTKKTCSNVYVKQTNYTSPQRRRCCNNYSYNYSNNCGCDYRRRCRISPFLWLFALFLI